MERKKTTAELENELEDQLIFLRKSSRAYDEGEIREAKRLATSLYILLHDGPGNKSLLKKLGLRSRLPLLSTALKQAPDGSGGQWMGFGPPLTVLQMGEMGTMYLPHCASSAGPPRWSRRTGFKDWWEESVAQAENRPLSRKGLVFIVRSQDGGSHVDHKRKGESYITFLDTPASPGVQVTGRDGSELVPSNPHFASIRQVAWELDYALAQLGH